MKVSLCALNLSSDISLTTHAHFQGKLVRQRHCNMNMWDLAAELGMHIYDIIIHLKFKYTTSKSKDADSAVIWSKLSPVLWFTSYYWTQEFIFGVSPTLFYFSISVFCLPLLRGYFNPCLQGPLAEESVTEAIFRGAQSTSGGSDTLQCSIFTCLVEHCKISEKANGEVLNLNRLPNKKTYATSPPSCYLCGLILPMDNLHLATAWKWMEPGARGRERRMLLSGNSRGSG